MDDLDFTGNLRWRKIASSTSSSVRPLFLVSMITETRIRTPAEGARCSRARLV